MTPRVLVRTAALGALAAAAGSSDPDFAPLAGCQVFLGQTWPSQSPLPGSAPMPNQLLIYGWEERSETVATKTTAPQFDTVMTLVIEARVETRAPAAAANLPAQPTQAAIDAAVDGALDALGYAVKKAICQGLGAALLALYPRRQALEEIRRIDTQNKYSETGQRMAGNGAVAFDIVYGEWFEPLIPNALDEAVILINPEAGSLANLGNSGNGTIAAVVVGLGAMPGTYAVALTSASQFAVTAPDSSPAGSGVVGTQFNGGGVIFTIGAGTVPFVAGDGFSVIVEVQVENLVTFS